MLGNLIVGLVVLLSTIIVVRKLYKTLSGKSGCGCNCGTGKGSASGCCSSGCHMKVK